jgi:hypothetical protein
MRSPKYSTGVGLADDSKSVKRFHIEENDQLLEGGFEHTLKQRGFSTRLVSAAR